MYNKKSLIKIIFVFLFIIPLAKVAVAQINIVGDTKGLLADIPEPPNARSELPSPVPMVYRFMGALMEGDYDVCLSNFDVQTFLELLFGKQLKRLDKEDYNDLFAYQVQTHRNEFRFLSKIMNRVAGGAVIDYSDPRYNGKKQCKVVIKLDTNRGLFEYHVYCRFVRQRWYVYDYILNGQRLTQVFRDSIKNVKLSYYLDSLKLFYAPLKGTRPIRNKEYEFSMMVPTKYTVQEKINPSLLATVTGLGGRFLLHVQAANYETPQTLAQVGKAIKDTLMPFNPRLYDQWKADIAGVEIGNILFHFTQGDRILYCHMVLIPLGRKLVVLNFYHSSLQIMKHMTNIRDGIIHSLSLPRIEAAGGVMPGKFADEVGNISVNEFDDNLSFDDDSLSFDDDNAFNEDTTFDNDNSLSQPNNDTDSLDDTSSSNNNTDEDDYDYDSNASNVTSQNSESDDSTSNNDSDLNIDDFDEDSFDWEGGSSNNTTTGDDDVEMLRPDSYVEDDGSGNDDDIDRDSITIPSSGGYGDGHFGDNDDYDFDGGEEVAF